MGGKREPPDLSIQKHDKVLIKAVKWSGHRLITADYVNKTPHTDTRVA